MKHSEERPVLVNATGDVLVKVLEDVAKVLDRRAHFMGELANARPSVSVGYAGRLQKNELEPVGRIDYRPGIFKRHASILMRSLSSVRKPKQGLT